MTRRYRWLVLGVVLLAFALRLGAVFVYGAYISPELWEFEEIANNLLSGKGFVYRDLGTDYRSYIEPLYPLLTYVVYTLSHHSYLAMALVNVLLSTALVPVVYMIARLTFGPVVALWAEFLVAVDPGLIRYAAKFHSLSLDALLMALVVLALLRSRSVLRAASYILLGVVMGLCVLTRPTVLAFFPFSLLWLFISFPANLARRVPLVVLALALGVAIVAPWLMRNYVVHHRFILTRTTGPFVFWRGNHAGWSGSSMTQSGQSLFLAAPGQFRERVLSSDELGQHDIFWQEAMSFVRQDPVGFLSRTAAKFLYFWWFSPQFGVQYRGERIWIYQLFYAIVAFFAATGLLLAVGGKLRDADRWAWLLLLTFLLSLSLFQSLYYVEGRHRLGVEAILLVFSASGIVAVLPGVREAKRLVAKGLGTLN